MKKMCEVYGLKETTVCIHRLINIGISLERDKEFSVEELSARATLEDKIIKRGLDCLEYIGIFRKNTFNGKYYVPGALKI